MFRVNNNPIKLQRLAVYVHALNRVLCLSFTLGGGLNLNDREDDRAKGLTAAQKLSLTLDNYLV